MDKEIVQGNIADAGAYDVAFKDGKLVAKASAGKSGVSAAVEFSVDADVVLDAIAKAIPGQIDDMVIGVIKTALKA